MSVQGIKGIEGALVARGRDYALGLEKGLKKAGLFLQRESQKVVPVDTGDLRNSANTRAEGSGAGTEVVVGYGTTYGLYVHEDLEARHKPGKQAKFLEEPLRKHRKRIVQIVAESIDEET